MTRETILQSCRQYFEEQKSQESKFIPGKTYIPVTSKVLDAEDLVHLVDASLDLWLTSGRFTEQFEKELSSRFERKSRALMVNSGSSANLIAISSLGSPLLNQLGMQPLVQGDEVITVAAGFPTTVNPIVQNGWTPVFVDIDLATLNATPELIQSAKTSKTRAVVLAHTLGNPFRADILRQWCQKEGLYLIEDCCDALGASIQGQSVGSFGDFATVSFYPAHHITTGEGGALIPRDGKLKRVAESLRDWGRDCWCAPGRDNTCSKRYQWCFEGLPSGYDHKYVYSSLGYNLKATDLQAALGISQLKKLDHFISERRKNWLKLYTSVTESPILHRALSPVVATAGTEPSWFGFAVHCREGINREKLVQYLEAHRVGTRLLFGSNLTKQPAYQNVKYRVHGSLSATDEILKNTFWMGVHPGLDVPRIEYMLEQLEKGIQDQI